MERHYTSLDLYRDYTDTDLSDKKYTVKKGQPHWVHWTAQFCDVSDDENSQR